MITKKEHMKNVSDCMMEREKQLKDKIASLKEENERLLKYYGHDEVELQKEIERLEKVSRHWYDQLGEARDNEKKLSAEISRLKAEIKRLENG